MARHQVQGQRRLPIAVELGPVHGDDNFPSRAHQMRDPVGEALPNIDLLIAEQAVNLLDRVLGHQTPSLRQSLPDHRHRQRGARHDPERRPRQGINPLGMNAVPVQIVDEIPNILELPAKPPLRLLHGTLEAKIPNMLRIWHQGPQYLAVKNEGIREVPSTVFGALAMMRPSTRELRPSTGKYFFRWP